MVETPILRAIAKLISWLFHPLLILTYMIILLMIINPYAFGISSLGEGRSGLLIIIVFLQGALIPGIAISMMSTLGLIPSLTMEDRMGRIGPFIASGILYLWLFINFNRLPEVPLVFKAAILGCIIALFTAFTINLFSKISLHTIGMGALVGMVIISMLYFGYNNFQIGDKSYSLYSLLFFVVFLAGLVGSARMILLKHEPKDLYGGYLVGFATQLIALQLLG